MLRFYHSMFFTLYSWARKVASNPTPDGSAMFALAFLAFVNLVTLNGYYGLLSGGKAAVRTFTKEETVAVCICFAIAGYFMFIRGKKFKIIEREFSEETLSQKRLRVVVTLVYIAVSIGLFVLMLTF